MGGPLGIERCPSRYATFSEIESSAYSEINRILDRINVDFQLADHSVYNQERFPWAQRYLSHPQFYGSRLWEYPWCIIESQLKPGMKCADIGCGESPLTIYLKNVAGCEIIGFDHDIHTEDNTTNFGVSQGFIRRTGISVVRSSVDDLHSPDEIFDRVFCVSVIEHIDQLVTRSKGMKEIARILKPGGLALITVDVNLMSRLANPLELAWESGLTFDGAVDLTMPRKRLGVFCDGRQPADVFGLVLRKEDARISVRYGDEDETVEAWRAALLRDTIFNGRLEDNIHADLGRFNVKGKPSLLTRLLIAIKVLSKMYPGVS